MLVRHTTDRESLWIRVVLCFDVRTVKRKLQSKGFHNLSYLLLTDHLSSALIKFEKASMFILQL